MILLRLKKSASPLNGVELVTTHDPDYSATPGEQTAELPGDLAAKLIACGIVASDVQQAALAETILCSNLRASVSLFAGIGAASRMARPCHEVDYAASVLRESIAAGITLFATGENLAESADSVERLLIFAQETGERWADIVCRAIREAAPTRPPFPPNN